MLTWLKRNKLGGWIIKKYFSSPLPPYSTLEIAQEFLDVANSIGKKISPQCLSKLMYIAHGYCLVNFHKPLINESISAFPYGPSIYNVYRATKDYRKGPIEKSLTLERNKDIEMDLKNLIKKVYFHYGHLNSLALAKITNAPNSAWFKAYTTTSGDRKISNDLIAESFKDQAIYPPYKDLTETYE